MKLRNVARRADDTELYDAYTGAFLFRAQVSSFIDNQLDGAISKRRPISFAPDKRLPRRMVIQYGGERWILGDVLKDFHRGRPIRVSAAAKKATGLFSILTPGQAAANLAGADAYGQLLYLKDTVDTNTTSAYSAQFEVYFSITEAAPRYGLLKLGNSYFHIRSSYPVVDGFVCAICDELGEARVPAVFQQRGAYSPATDTYAETLINTHVIEFDYYKLYNKPTADAAKQVTGDLTLLVAATAVTPVVGNEVTYRGAQWRVFGVEPDQDAWRTHVRRI